MQIGNIVRSKMYGIGKIVSAEEDAFALYLVYYYKSNLMLHDGHRGLDNHYWYHTRESITLVPSLNTLVERRRHG